MSEDFPPEECPECGSLNTVYSKSRDEVICNDCGCIYARPVAIRLGEKPEKKRKTRKRKARAAKKKAKSGKPKKRKEKKGRKRR